MFTNAVVKPPCNNMVKGITQAGLGRPDYSLALEQHARYVEALETCGLAVTVLEADEKYPDSTFIEDTCLVTGKCAVITRPGADSRKGETSAVARAMARFDLPLYHLSAPATLDAGDIMMVGDHFYVGLSERTNDDGVSQLADLLAPMDIPCPPYR